MTVRINTLQNSKAEIYGGTQGNMEEHHDTIPTKITKQHNLLPRGRICTQERWKKTFPAT